MIFSMILLSITLSIDALFLGLAFGANKKKIPLFSKLAICSCSVLYASISLLAGSYIFLILPNILSKLIGAILLFLIGLTFVIKAFIEKEVQVKTTRIVAKEKKPFKIVIKSIAITIEILKNPDSADIDNSGIVDIKEALFIGTALSIDSIGVGIGSAMSGLHGWYLAFVIGFFQLLFLNLGQHLIKHLSFLFSNKHIGNLLPGIMLITLSIIRFFIG